MANTSGVLSQWIKLSYKTGTGSSYTALDDLQSIPDLGATPDQIDITCMGDTARRYMNGIKDYGSLEFGFLFDDTQFATLEGLTGDVDFKVEISATSGASTPDATFSFKGQPSVRLNGAGVNEALTYTLSVALKSDIALS